MPFKKGNRFGGRRSARNSSALTRTPTPQHARDDDVSEDGTGEDAPGPGDELDQDGDVDIEDAVDTGPGDEEDDENNEDEDEDDIDDVRPPTTLSLKRRPGRPRGSTAKRSRRDIGTPDPGEEYSESGTPRRKRGRPSSNATAVKPNRGGFRGRRKGQQIETPRVVIDKEGTTLDVVNDEALVDQDDAGDAKVDENGNLSGGREYRVRTFTIMNRDDRLYMLSTEPARCCGFRDSYLFFTKHPKLYKVLISEEEKMDLIAREILPNSYKGRNIGVVTARSVFREFGARIIVGGRRVIDDYKEAEAIANGVPEGELADPDDYVPENREEYNRNRYVAWFGASDVYRQAAGGGPVQVKAAIGKRRTNITTTNWQYLHAREASRFNSSLTALRKANLNGVYDTHTNMMFYPRITQPTHAVWTEVPPAEGIDGSKRLNNGASHPSTNPSSHGDGDGERPSSRDGVPASIFTDIPSVISRNFIVVDVVCQAPPISHSGYPGPDGNVMDFTSGPNGLASVPMDLVDELPDDCRRAFMEARSTETTWKKQWGTEHQTAHRGDLKIGFSGYPV